MGEAWNMDINTNVYEKQQHKHKYLQWVELTLGGLTQEELTQGSKQ